MLKELALIARPYSQRFLTVIQVDGGQKSGSGTIVRYSVALAALLGKELELINIRSKRKNPGLRIQHLAAVRALAELCGAEVEGGTVGASNLVFRPKKPVMGGRFEWDIGTAGSTTMFVLTILPAACLALTPLTCRISGGLFQDFAPSAYHMQRVLFSTLRKMGVEAELKIVRPGYVPSGGGVIEVNVIPAKEGLKALDVLDAGKVVRIEGVALSSHLEDRKVSERMASACEQPIRTAGYDVSISKIYDDTALQAGAALALFAYTDSGCIIGADGAGAPGRTSERIGRSVARRLIEDMATGASVDRFLADQLVLFAALARGHSRYRIPRITEHVETNLWLVRTILAAKAQVGQDMVVEIEGTGLGTG